LNRKEREERKEKLRLGFKKKSLGLLKKPFAFFAFFAVNPHSYKARQRNRPPQ
jgi:hypothetical protein